MVENENKTTKKEEKQKTKKVVKEKNSSDIEELKKELKEELKKEVLEEMKEKIKEEKKESEVEEKTEEKSFEEKTKDAVNKLMDTPDSTEEHDKKDIESNKAISILSYLGPLALIPFLVSKESKFAQYHAKQGLNLFIVEISIGLVSYFLTSVIRIPRICTLWGDVTYECGSITPWWITLPISLIELFVGVVALIGLIYACQGKAKEVPVLGKIKIIK